MSLALSLRIQGAELAPLSLPQEETARDKAGTGTRTGQQQQQRQQRCQLTALGSISDNSDGSDSGGNNTGVNNNNDKNNSNGNDNDNYGLPDPSVSDRSRTALGRKTLWQQNGPNRSKQATGQPGQADEADDTRDALPTGRPCHPKPPSRLNRNLCGQGWSYCAPGKIKTALERTTL